jgi:hypothetical protein
MSARAASFLFRFFVFAGTPVEAAYIDALKSQPRYITRPALGMDALNKLDDVNLAQEQFKKGGRNGER